MVTTTMTADNPFYKEVFKFCQKHCKAFRDMATLEKIFGVESINKDGRRSLASAIYEAEEVITIIHK